MGMYTSIRFKGVVKHEYLDGFEDIAISGEWENSKHEIFREFGKMSRASFIPCGGLSYCPWEESMRFRKYYDNLSGYWQFECSLKNYNGEIEVFKELIPKFVEDLYHFEEMYEEEEYSTLYELKNSVLVPSGRYAWKICE